MPWVSSEAFAEIARGNKDAEAFMGHFYIWVHFRDDLFDKDKPVTAENAAGIDLQTLSAFASNPFFQRHQTFLLPVLTMGALAWVASEDCARNEDVIIRITSQVLKSQYLDVFLAVAFCIGGFGHAAAMGRKYREYHFDDEKPQGVGALV